MPSLRRRTAPFIRSVDLWLMNCLMNRVICDTMMNVNRSERKVPPPGEKLIIVLYVANETQQLVDDEKKFVVSLYVSQFRPEELNVEGCELTIEGKQEHKTENSAIHRSLTRKWLLPENVDLGAIRSQLDDKGHLSVKAPKTVEGQAQKKIHLHHGRS